MQLNSLEIAGNFRIIACFKATLTVTIETKKACLGCWVRSSGIRSLPGRPGCPCLPGMPGKPLSPGEPGSPGGPCSPGNPIGPKRNIKMGTLERRSIETMAVRWTELREPNTNQGKVSLRNQVSLSLFSVTLRRAASV